MGHHTTTITTIDKRGGPISLGKAKKMRPYTDKEGKTPKKRTRRGEKALSGVKKSLVKAKVSAVKTSRKIQNGNSEEVEDLLNSTANGATPKAKEVAAKVGRPSNAAKQMKKLKSLVKCGVTPTRKSKRLSQKAEAKMDVVDVSVAEEAVEAEQPQQNGNSNGGFLQRTISKIWKLPTEGLTGVPYSDIQANGSPEKQKPVETETQNGEAEAASPAPFNKLNYQKVQTDDSEDNFSCINFGSIFLIPYNK